MQLSALEKQTARRGSKHQVADITRRRSVLSTHFLVMTTFMIYNSFILEQVPSIWLEVRFIFLMGNKFYDQQLNISVFGDLKNKPPAPRRQLPPTPTGFTSLSTFAVVLCQALHHLTACRWQVVLVKGKRKECTAAVAGLIKRLASDYLFSTCVTNFPHFLNACAHGPEFTHSCSCSQVFIIDDIWLRFSFFFCQATRLCVNVKIYLTIWRKYLPTTDYLFTLETLLSCKIGWESNKTLCIRNVSTLPDVAQPKSFLDQRKCMLNEQWRFDWEALNMSLHLSQ